MELKWYQKTWVIVLIIILFLPAGIVLVVINKRWSVNRRIVWIVISTLIYLWLIYIASLDGINIGFK